MNTFLHLTRESGLGGQASSFNLKAISSLSFLLLFILLTTGAFAQTCVQGGGSGSYYSCSTATTFAAETGFANISGTFKTFSVNSTIDVSGVDYDDQTIFQTERYGNNFTFTDLSYTDGEQVIVDLYFVEIFNGAQSIGARVFDVEIEGNLVLDDYDIYADVGYLVATVKSFPVTITGGDGLVVEFTTVADNAKISAICIRPDDAGMNPNRPTVTINTPSDGDNFVQGGAVGLSGTATDTEDGDISASIEWSSDLDGTLGTGASLNASGLTAGVHEIRARVEDSGTLSGGDCISITILGETPVGSRFCYNSTTSNTADVTLGGQLWQSDNGVVTISTSNATTSADIEQSTDLDVIYQSERWKNQDFGYDFFISNGSYLVELHFAEIYYVSTGGGSGNQGAGVRVFDVDIEGTEVLSNYDINDEVTKAGLDNSLPTALVESFINIPVTDNMLELDFKKGIGDNPKVSGVCFTRISLAALPVELVSFGAVAQGSTAVLKWETATETNNDKFIIEKSLDGKSFQSIGAVKGAGNTEENQVYQFKDESFSQTSYYRLKQMDFDGTYAYSHITYVIGAAKEDKFTIFPNPTSSHVRLQFNGSHEGEFSLKVYGINGATTFLQASDMTQLSNLLNEELDQLPAGMYVLELVNGSTQYKQKLIKH